MKEKNLNIGKTYQCEMQPKPIKVLLRLEILARVAQANDALTSGGEGGTERKFVIDLEQGFIIRVEHMPSFSRTDWKFTFHESFRKLSMENDLSESKNTASKKIL